MTASIRAQLGSASSTTSGTKTVTATPAVGDLVVCVVANSDNVATPSMTDNNADGLGTYTLVQSALARASVDRLCVFVRNAPVGSATSTVFTMAPGTTSGGAVVVYALAGVAVAGSLAVRQSAKADNQAAGGTPAVTFGGPALGIDSLIGVVLNATTAGLTKPASFDSARVDGGYATPAIGVHIVTDDIGNTDTTVTWGATSATDFAVVVVEFHSGFLVPIAAASTVNTGGVIRPRKRANIAAPHTTDTAGTITLEQRRQITIGQAFESDAMPNAPVSEPAKPQWAANVDFGVYEPLIGRTYDAIRDYVGMEDTPGTANRVIGTRRRLLSIKCYSPDGMIMYYVQGPDRNVVSLSWLAGRAHVEFDNPVHARIGKPFVLEGQTPTAYRGTWIVDSVVSSTQLNLVMTNDPGTATVLGTGHAKGITQGAWDTQIDAWAAWLATQPAMDLVLHHEPDHLPGSFTEFPGRDSPGSDQADFKAANAYVWTRLQAGGVSPTLVKFGFCPIAATVRAGRANLYYNAACHGFMAVDGYSGSAAVSFSDIFAGSDTFCAANGLDFYVWETNVNLGTDDQGEHDWWEAVPAQAAAMNCSEVALWIGTTQTMNPSTEPLKFAGYTAAGLAPYFTDLPSSGGATFTPMKLQDIGQVLETDTAQTFTGELSGFHHVNIGQVLETDTAQILAPLLPEPPDIDTLEVIVPKFRRRAQLPAVAWVLAGIPVQVADGWSANAVADGGMDKFNGYIPASVLLANPNKFRQGARITGFVGSQQVVYDGLLTGDPVISGGTAKVEAAGQKARAELASGRLLYQSRDYSLFQDGGEPPMDFAPFTEEIEGEVKSSALFWHLIKDFAYQTNDAFPLAAWISGALVTRVAGDIIKSGDVSDCQIRVQSFTGPSGVRTILDDFGLGAAGADDFDVDIDEPEDGVVFNVRFSADNTVAAHRYIRIRNLRVNGIAVGDEFFTSDVVRDLGERLGYDTRFRIIDSGTNALPFDLTTGTWSQEGLSYMSLLDDWRWLVLEDRGHGPILDYGPWERVWYVQRMQDAMPDFRPLPLYNKVVVRYKAANGTLQQVEAEADPNPLAGTGRDNVWYEDLSDAQPDDVLATLVADALVTKLATPRYTGSVDIVGARLNSGTGNAYSVRPGDLLDVSDWVPAGHIRQRIVEVEYRSDGVRLGIEAPITADGVIALYGLERARRKKGKAFAGSGG